MATLDDIALAAGVSKSTVSRVLNDRITSVPISPETRQRVLQAAERLRYQPNLFARGLKTRRSRIIGLSLRDFTNPFWGGLIKGINAGCGARGYHLILSNTTSEGDEEQIATTFLGQLGVDGLLIAGDFPGDESTMQRIRAHAPVAVAVCRGIDASLLPVIHVDDRRGFRLLMDHLYALGHRHIGFAGLLHPEGFAERHVAFRNFMAAHHLPVAEPLIDLTDVGQGFPSEDELVQAGEAAADRILRSGAPIDALACACDPMALGAFRAAARAGLRVPDELSIAGFDDAPLARYCSPLLTTVRQPVVEMGRAAADLIIDLVEGRTSPPTEPILFAPELIVRGSTAPAERPGRR